jgi:hypothetical protein
MPTTSSGSALISEINAWSAASHYHPATMFFLSHSLAGASRDNEMQRVHILCNGKQQQLLILVDFALLNSFSFLM